MARSSTPLEKLKSEYPDQFEFVTGDLGDFATAKAAVERAVTVFGKIDSVIVNHGVLDPVSKIVDADLERWREAFDIGFLSAVALVRFSTFLEFMMHWIAKEGLLDYTGQRINR